MDAAYVKRIANATGFDAVQLEKVIRLRQLLIEFRKHSFLRERLVLKGGTAVNLFYLELARLSVDIDLNYIGQLDREQMQRERPEIVKAAEQISKALGYKVQRSADDYALNEWFLTYQSHVGSFDQIQIEINFLMRACALPPELRQAISIGDEAECEFPVLAIEELFAGKIRAMIDRKHPRDLYDLFRFREANLNYDSEAMRKLAVLFGSTLSRDLRSYNLSRFADIDAEAIKRLLYPLLKAGDRPAGTEMFAVAKPILESVLDHRREASFLEAIAAGKYQPELLFPKDAGIVNRIRSHPALLWKAENVRQYLSKQKPS
ncbi:MAG: nucleotidyl transferase AbiEii/AbiGii toxin family protein [Candidatus Acidiferrum sp.]